MCVNVCVRTYLKKVGIRGEVVFLFAVQDAAHLIQLSLQHNGGKKEE